MTARPAATERSKTGFVADAHSMNVFLTGASGYVGSHVAAELVSRGHRITGLARQKSDRTRSLTDIAWRYADLADPDAYRDTLNRADAVVHCAMDYAAGAENSELDRSFVASLRDFGGHFVYTGNLFCERTEAMLEEAVRTGSEHWRFQAEQAALSSAKLASVIRLGFVYGGRGGFFWDILSPGTLAGLDVQATPDAIWPMVHVKDVALLYASVLESRTPGVFHAFDGKRVGAREIIEAARRVYKSRGVASLESHDYIHGLLRSSVVTSNRRALETGWTPMYSSFVDNEDLAFEESQVVSRR